MKVKKILCGLLMGISIFGITITVHAEEFQNGRSIPLLTEEMLGDATSLSVMQSRMAGSVSAGYVTGYLSAAGEYALYDVTIPSGHMFQAQLEQPGNTEIDYDLYLFDSNQDPVDVSAVETYVANGRTLVEGVGMINSSEVDEDYILLVNSFSGGSTSEAYILTYAFTDVYDENETDENPYGADEITLSGSSYSISDRNISSPIDSDWYYVTVPSGYNEMELSINSSSNNVHAIQTYENVSSSGACQMAPVSLSNGRNSVSVGDVYYFRVCYGGTLNGFDQDSIENYTFSINFYESVPEAGSITITEFEGGTYVTYGYGRLYRVTGSTLTVKGIVRDTQGHALPNAPVMVGFANPAWEGDSTRGFVTATGYTNSSGVFSIVVNLPPSAGLERYYVDPTTHHYDTCQVIAIAGNNIIDYDYVYQYAFSSYGNNT